MVPNCYRCGCEASVHHHYRAGTDCGRCGKEKCWGYAGPPDPHQDTVVLFIALGLLLIGCLIFYTWLT